ncbi:hypothetical protein MMC17_004812, partial [Xylographa soralifera]|nr:hypothetical protein [Xylographa soralifera]
MMRFACQQVRKEAVASFEKQKRRLRSKAARLMDRVAETYEFGVCLKVFEDSPAFDAHLKATMVQLMSLERTSGEVFGTKDDLMHEIEDPLGSENSLSSSDDEDDDE